MNLFKSTLIISALTLVSRIAGLVREVLFAAYFGASSQTDAFFVAFRIPNLLRRLFAEGALSQAFIPVLSEVKAKNGISACQKLGFKSVHTEFDFADVMERVQRIIKKVEPHDSIERYTSLGVECHTGEAKIFSPYEVLVDGKVLTTRNIVIATGARPYIPSIEGIENVEFLTSDTIWDIRKQPKKLLVLGGYVNDGNRHGFIQTEEEEEGGEEEWPEYDPCLGSDDVEADFAAESQQWRK